MQSSNEVVLLSVQVDFLLLHLHLLGTFFWRRMGGYLVWYILSGLLPILTLIAYSLYFALLWDHWLAFLHVYLAH